MLTQSSSAEVFYDKIRQELRVTSVHQCDSLKSLGRIIGAVTVAFLEEAPKYNHDDSDDVDEVQSSDQVSQCLLDRSKVWEGIPASLSLMPVPGASYSQQSSQQYSTRSQAREQCTSVVRPPGKASDYITEEADKESHVEGDCKFGKANRVGREFVSLATSMKEKQNKVQALVTGEKVDVLGQNVLQVSKSSHEPQASCTSRNTKIAIPNIARDENSQANSDLDENKLSSPSVTNSFDSLWRVDTDNTRKNLSPESSTRSERDIDYFTCVDSSRSSYSERFSHKSDAVKAKDRSRDKRSLSTNSGKDEHCFSVHTTRKRNIDHVVVKQEVFHDLCQSSDEAEDNRDTSFSGFDNQDNVGEENVDMIGEEYLDGEDTDLVKGKCSELPSSSYLFGDARSSFLNPYSGLGETAFPGITSLDMTSSGPSAFPFALPATSYVSQEAQRKASASSSSSSISRFRTALLPQYPSSSSLLHFRSQGKKSHRKVPTCAVCYAEIRDKNDFAAHASLHSLEDQHNCPVCLKIFSNRANLLRHSALHILGVLYQCPICCKMIKRGDNFQVHMRKQHPGQSVKMARIVTDLSQDNLCKALYTSTRSISTGSRFQWFGKSSVKSEPECPAGKPTYSPDRTEACGSVGSRLLADSSSERESLDLSLHPRLCPYCVKTYTSSTSLANHIEEVHADVVNRSTEETRLPSRSCEDDDIYAQYIPPDRPGPSFTK